MQTLGDILTQATKEKTMRKIDVSIRISDKGKKINAIKTLRSITGQGLVEAKQMVECDFYTRVRMTAEQFGVYVAQPSGYEIPSFFWSDAVIVPEDSAPLYDFSQNV